MNKGISICVIAITLSAFIGFGTTQAYLTYKRGIMNNFRVGYNEITVTEEYDPPDEIVPDEITEFRKNVQIKNTGTIPCFVRVRLEYSDSDIKKFCTNILNGNYIKAGDYTNEIERISNGDWIYNNDDNCYYYTKVLEEDERTSLLLDRVQVLVPKSEEDNLKEFEIYVYAESIQTMINVENSNGSIVAKEAEDYMEAWNQILRKGN